MINKLKCNKGFTLIEMTIALALTGMLMLTLFSLLSFLHDTLKRNSIEDSLHAVCVQLIEEKQHTLHETHSLPCGTQNVQDSVSNIEYTMSYDTVALDYPGMYKLKITIRASQNSMIQQEVLLYAYS